MLNIESCWQWPGFHRKTDGRAIVSHRYVYRLIYEAATGEPITGNLHHTCENSWCINPWHVEPLSQSDHAKTHGRGGDWGQANKTHCRNGHPYDAENTYVYQTKDGSRERHCRTCMVEAKRRYRTRKEKP